jgi:transposase
LAEIVEKSPQDFGYSRPTWTRELLAKVRFEKTRVEVSIRTLGRMLRRIDARLGQPKPTVKCPWSKWKKTRKINKIKKAVENLPPDEVAYFEDEIDVHLNPKIGPDWMLKGQQKEVETPGQNKKEYVAGAMSTDRSDLIWVTSTSKSSNLFIELLKANPTAKKIHLVLDNYIIHKSKITQRFIESLKGRIVLHFLPPYSPDHNKIERFWRELHANVTRNHKCKTMDELMDNVVKFLQEQRTKMRREARKLKAA